MKQTEQHSFEEGRDPLQELSTLTFTRASAAHDAPLRALISFLTEDKDGIEFYLAGCVTKKFTEGSTIVAEAERSQTCFILTKGTVDILQKNNAGKDELLKSVHAPALLGELAPTTGKRTTTMRSSTYAQATLVEVPGDALLLHLSRDSSRQLLDTYLHDVQMRLRDSIRFAKTEPSVRSEISKFTQHVSALAEHEPAQTDEHIVLSKIAAYVADNPDSAIIRRQNFKENELIYREGDPSDDFLFVLNGDVSVERWDETALEGRGAMQFIPLSPGQKLFGEMSAKSGSRTANLFADSPVEALVFRGALLRGLMRTDKEFAQAYDRIHASRTSAVHPSVAHPNADKHDDDTLKSDISTASDRESIHRFIRRFMETRGPLPEKAGMLIGEYEDTNGRTVVIYNKDGVPFALDLTKDNALEILGVLRTLGKNSNLEYPELRLACLRIDPSIPAHLAYTNGPVPVVGYQKIVSEDGGEEHYGYRPYYKTEASWTPSRDALHAHVLADSLERAGALSTALSESLEAAGIPQPALILVAGNTGAGKTTTLRSKEISQMQRLGLGTITEGIIRPDDVKSVLRADAKNAAGKHTILHDQLFVEGGVLGMELITQAMNKRFNLVIDKRFCTKGEVDAITIPAKNAGYKSVVMIDVEANAITSTRRIHGDPLFKDPVTGVTPAGRDKDGDDPIVPVEFIKQGFADKRKYRKDIIDGLKNMSDMHTEYYLLQTDNEEALARAAGTGTYPPPVLVAAITPYEHMIPNTYLYNELTSPLTESEVSISRATVDAIMRRTTLSI